MLRKAKRLPVIVILVLITIFLGSLFGCGDGSAVDPLGTGIIQFYDATTGVVITSVTVQPGGTLTLVVKVKNLRSDGTLAPVIGERVSFTLLNAANGGVLTVRNDRTAGDGQAMADYTAGNNFAIDYVRATTDAGATATITITKTGGIIGARISTLTASSAAVAADQTSTITATVTDGNANPMMGEAVTFTIPTNDSGACFINAAGACVASVIAGSDASGRAVAVYKGGGNSPDVAVYDTVRAALANGSTNAVSITRSAGAAAVTGYVVTVTANPSTIKTNAVSVVTANVKDSNGAVVTGVAVDFTVTGPVAGPGTVPPGSVTTDGAGNAVTTYTAPAAAGSSSVTATVTIGGVRYTGAAAIDYAP